MADEYYIGQWNWVTEDESFWQAPQPQFLTGVIDLRNITDQSEKGGNPKGYALFAYSQEVTDAKLTHLGGNLDEAPNVKARGAIQSKLGINPVSNTIRDIIYELLTQEADPTGITRWKPSRPNKSNKIKIYFGSEGVIKEVVLIPNVSPEWPMVVRAMQEDYRHMLRTEEPDRIAKALDMWEEQFGVPYQTFIPKDAIQIASLPHATTITESFNTADSDTLGPSLTWTEVSLDTDIVSNQAKFMNTTGTALVRADSDLSSDDHYAQCEIHTQSAASRGYGPICRKDSTATLTFYHARYLNTTDLLQLFKFSGGTGTQLGSSISITYAAGKVVKVYSDGSTIKAFYDGGELVSATDSAITGNLRTGMRHNTNIGTSIVDNFEAADLSAAPAARRTIFFN